MHAEQRRARLDLVGWATSDGAAHVLSCGYRGPYPHNNLVQVMLGDVGILQVTI